MIRKLIRDGALFVSNHSGGKDSQAMYLRLSKIIPPEQLVVIHAHLPEVEWEGTFEHLQATVNHELHIVQAKKTFFEMVEHRQMFPSPKNRQCTSDLKRGPIQKKVKEICNTKGFSIVVNCMGLRADESSGRKKKPKFTLNNTNTNSKRTWYDWLPIHSLSTEEVFNVIKDAGQDPHWVYAAGMTRKSCKFCIMSSKEDLCTAAKLDPALLQRYVDTEKRIGHTLIMPSKKNGKQFLSDIVE